MKFKTVIFYLSAFAFLVMPTFAEKTKKKITNSETAKMILGKAIKNLMNIKSFSAILPSQKGVSIIVMQKNNSDGSIFVRTEIKEKRFTMISVFNHQGLWNLIGDTAIKMSFFGKIQKKKMINTIEIPSLNGTYSYKKDKIRKIECFVVTVRLSLEEIKEMAKLAIKMLPENFKIKLKKKGKINLSNSIAAITKYHIGQKNFFIYKTEKYNTIGKKIAEKTYLDVKLDLNLDEKKFQIPKHMKIKIANTLKDYSKIMEETLKKEILKK